MWRTYSCYVCSGYKHIEVGREQDGIVERIELCPLCDGKGHLNVPQQPYHQPSSENFWKRMLGDGGIL